MTVLCLTLARPASAQSLEAFYPEGPLWQGDKLYFAEMAADRVTVRDHNGARAFFSQKGCGPTAIAPYGDGFLVLCHRGARVVAVNAKGRELRRWAEEEGGKGLIDPNDAAADERGGVYFSDPGLFAESSRAKPRGRVMHLSADGALKIVARSLAYPNGVTVRDDSLYVSEHLRGRILRFPIETDGRLGKAIVFSDLSHRAPTARYSSAYPLSGPDGLEFSSDGALYVAIYGEGRLLKLSPTGEILRDIDAPARFVTNVAFGKHRFATTGTFDNHDAALRGEVRVGAGVP